MDNDLPPPKLNGWTRAEELVRWRMDNQDERLDSLEKDFVRLKESVDRLPGKMAMSVLSVIVGILASVAASLVLRVVVPEPRPTLDKAVERLIEQLEYEKAQRGKEVRRDR